MGSGKKPAGSGGDTGGEERGGRPDEAAASPTTGPSVSGGLEGLVEEAERLAEAITDEAQERARGTLDSAEAEATARLEAAYREAAAVLEERRQRYGELSDAIIAHADLVLEHLRGASDARGRLDQAVRALRDESQPVAAEEARTTEGGQEAPAVGAEPAEEPADSSAVDAGATEGEPSAGRSEGDEVAAVVEGDSDADARLSGARLLALHMAVAGESRSDAEGYLRRVYGIAEPAAIVEEVFARYETRE